MHRPRVKPAVSAAVQWVGVVYVSDMRHITLPSAETKYLGIPLMELPFEHFAPAF